MKWTAPRSDRGRDAVGLISMACLLCACGSSELPGFATQPVAAPTTTMSAVMGMTGGAPGGRASRADAAAASGHGGAAAPSADAGMRASAGAAGLASSAGKAGEGAMAGGAGGVVAPAGAGTSAAGGTGAGATPLGGPLMYTGEFTMGSTIAATYKCPRPFVGGGMGGNKSPPLEWIGGPAGTKSFAIELIDTRSNFFHWAIWDIPPNVHALPEGLASGYALEAVPGAHQRAGNGDDDHAYFGPCTGGPTANTYSYRLFALSAEKLDLTENSMGPAITAAIDGATLEMTKWEGKPE